MEFSLVLSLLISLIFLFVASYIIFQIKVEDIPSYGFFTKDEFDSSKAKITTDKRINCSTQKHYCFEDNDCSTQCTIGGNYMCIHGICKDQRVVETMPDNRCDPKKGFEAFLVGNPNMGTYEYICKSIDQGIAIDIDTNKMCLNGTIDIDYTKSMPFVTDCKDANQMLIPATSAVRDYVIIDEKTYDIVTKSYSL